MPKYDCLIRKSKVAHIWVEIKANTLESAKKKAAREAAKLKVSDFNWHEASDHPAVVDEVDLVESE